MTKINFRSLRRQRQIPPRKRKSGVVPNYNAAYPFQKEKQYT
jgi:hypothetical protein